MVAVVKKRITSSLKQKVVVSVRGCMKGLMRVAEETLATKATRGYLMGTDTMSITRMMEKRQIARLQKIYERTLRMI